MRGYNFFTAIKLFIFLVYTKIFFNKAKLIRLPIYIKGRKHINFSKGFNSGRFCRIEAMPALNEKNPIINFGTNVEINDFVHIAAIESITISNNVLIASRVFISDHNHGKYTGSTQSNPLSIIKNRELSSKKIFIDDNVWIGEGAVILPGVTIGSNSIIGSNSVVTKNIPPNSIAAGIPAKIIKTYNNETCTWELCNGI